MEVANYYYLHVIISNEFMLVISRLKDSLTDKDHTYELHKKKKIQQTLNTEIFLVLKSEENVGLLLKVEWCKPMNFYNSGSYCQCTDMTSNKPFLCEKYNHLLCFYYYYFFLRDFIFKKTSFEKLQY